MQSKRNFSSKLGGGGGGPLSDTSFLGIPDRGNIAFITAEDVELSTRSS